MKVQKRYALIFRICWLVIVLSLAAIIWGILALKAHGSLKGASLAPMYCVAFGFVLLVAAAITMFIVRAQDNLYRRISKTTDSDVLLRWQCTPQEARRFIDSEAARLKIPRRMNLYFAIFLIVIGVGIAWLQSGNFELGSFLLFYATIGGFFALVFVLWRVQMEKELKDARDRALSEIIVTAEGIVAGEGAFKWRGFNLGLKEATYESGQPDVLNLVFLMGTLPGSATVRVAATATYLAGATSMPGATQSTMTVRIPVTATKSDEVRKLVSNEISQYLLKPSLIP
ncbi:MAG: hypothetical protein QOH88_1436 [Verrucomicrobiota bacterium]|jgi:hypothetical protein